MSSIDISPRRDGSPAAARRSLNRPARRGRPWALLVLLVAWYGGACASRNVAASTSPCNVDASGNSTIGLAGTEPDERKVSPDRDGAMIPPQLVQSEDFAQAMVRHYPSELRKMGMGGTVNVVALIDGRGEVAEVSIKSPGQIQELDEAAIRVMRETRFEPAVSGGCRMRVWIQLPIHFSVART